MLAPDQGLAPVPPSPRTVEPCVGAKEPSKGSIWTDWLPLGPQSGEGFIPVHLHLLCPRGYQERHALFMLIKVPLEP